MMEMEVWLKLKSTQSIPYTPPRTVSPQTSSRVNPLLKFMEEESNWRELFSCWNWQTRCDLVFEFEEDFEVDFDYKFEFDLFFDMNRAVAVALAASLYS